MLYGLDTAYAPSLAQAKQQYKLGWRFFGGYLGGPKALHAWSHDDFGRVASVGFVFLPIYVGLTYPYNSAAELSWDRGFADGLDADGLAGKCGFNESQPLCLDAEAGDWEQWGQRYTDYVDGWCAAVHDAGHSTILYSDALTVEAIGSHADLNWVADYVTRARYNAPPAGAFDPSSPPAWDAWQFDDQGYIAGVSVDMSSARDDFPFSVYTPPA